MSSEESASSQRLRLLLWIGTAAMLLCWNAPWLFNPPASWMDASWALVMSQASVAGEQWGRDIVFTYGPLADLATRQLLPERLFLMMGLQTLLLLAAFCSALYLMRRASLLDQAAVVLMMLISFALVQDTPFFLYPMLFVLLHTLRPQQQGLKCLLVLVMGLSSLVKFSYLILNLYVLVLADIDRLRLKRPPWYLAAFLLSYLAVYSLLGQSLSALPDYLQTSLQIVVGYSEAMSFLGAGTELLILFVPFWLLFNLSVFYLGEKRRRAESGATAAESALLLLSWIGFAFIAYKSGFVRLDELHWPTTFTVTGIVLMLYRASQAGVTVRGRTSRAFAGFVSIATLLLVLSSATLLFAQGTQLLLVLGKIADESLHTGSQLIASPGTWHAARQLEYEQALEGIRAKTPLPRLAGPVDSIASMQAAVIANGLDYRHRPVVQEYSTYTEGLSRLNGDFLLGAKAPDHLLLSLATIDYRWPSSAEGALWPQWMARYQTSYAESGYCIISRREKPLDVVLRPLGKHRVALGATVPVPAHQSLVMARITVKRSAFGKLVALAFQPAELFIEAETPKGLTLHRLIPAMATQGFMVSPYLHEGRQLGQLFLAPELGNSLDAVTAIRIIPSLRFQGQRQFEPQVEIEFFGVQFADQPEARTASMTAPNP